MKALATILFTLLFTPFVLAEETFISDVSLKIESGVMSPQVQCFVNEALKQVFSAYTLSKIAYSQIDEASLSQDENMYASIHFSAIQNTTGKLVQLVIILSAFDDANKWNYVQGKSSIYPYSPKISDFATTQIKNSGEMPSYLLLTTCK